MDAQQTEVYDPYSGNNTLEKNVGSDALVAPGTCDNIRPSFFAGATGASLSA